MWQPVEALGYRTRTLAWDVTSRFLLRCNFVRRLLVAIVRLGHAEPCTKNTRFQQLQHGLVAQRALQRKNRGRG